MVLPSLLDSAPRRRIATRQRARPPDRVHRILARGPAPPRARILPAKGGRFPTNGLIGSSVSENIPSSTTAAVRHRRWLLDCGNDSVWLASDGVFASATSVEILLFALTASRSNEPTGDALPTRSGAKGRLRIPLLSLPQAYGADEGVRQ